MLLTLRKAGADLPRLEKDAREEKSCGRCNTKLLVDYEYCWWCQGYLCPECWDKLGHCGHPEAEAVNERGRQRAAICGTFKSIFSP